MPKLRGKWIQFVEVPNDPDRKTKVWEVYASSGNIRLGSVRWYSAWRRFAFFTYNGIVLEETCLGDLQTFLREATEERKLERLLTPAPAPAPATA